MDTTSLQTSMDHINPTNINGQNTYNNIRIIDEDLEAVLKIRHPSSK